MAESEEELKSVLMKVKESEKTGLKFSLQKTRVMPSRSITPWQTDRENGYRDRLFSWAPKSLQMVTVAMKLKIAWSLEGKL